jgi:hypothetical protein
MRVKIQTVTGTTQLSNEGATTLSHSTAESTEIAGVIMPSPKRSPVANKRRKDIKRNFLSFFVCKRFRSAKGPPSPLLSARRTKTIYLIQMMITNIQKIRLETPTIFFSVSAKCACQKNTSLRAYKGDVPISP